MSSPDRSAPHPYLRGLFWAINGSLGPQILFVHPKNEISCQTVFSDSAPVGVAVGRGPDVERKLLRQLPPSMTSGGAVAGTGGVGDGRQIHKTRREQTRPVAFCMTFPYLAELLCPLQDEFCNCSLDVVVNDLAFISFPLFIYEECNVGKTTSWPSSPSSFVSNIVLVLDAKASPEWVVRCCKIVASKLAFVLRREQEKRTFLSTSFALLRGLRTSFIASSVSALNDTRENWYSTTSSTQIGGILISLSKQINSFVENFRYRPIPVHAMVPRAIVVNFGEDEDEILGPSVVFMSNIDLELHHTLLPVVVNPKLRNDSDDIDHANSDDDTDWWPRLEFLPHIQDLFQRVVATRGTKSLQDLVGEDDDPDSILSWGKELIVWGKCVMSWPLTPNSMVRLMPPPPIRNGGSAIEYNAFEHLDIFVPDFESKFPDLNLLSILHRFNHPKSISSHFRDPIWRDLELEQSSLDADKSSVSNSNRSSRSRRRCLKVVHWLLCRGLICHVHSFLLLCTSWEIIEMEKSEAKTFPLLKHLHSKNCLNGEVPLQIVLNSDSASTKDLKGLMSDFSSDLVSIQRCET